MNEFAGGCYFSDVVPLPDEKSAGTKLNKKPLAGLADDVQTVAFPARCRSKRLSVCVCVCVCVCVFCACASVRVRVCVRVWAHAGACVGVRVRACRAEWRGL